MAAFTLCLIRAIDQRLFEFRQTRQLLVESERQHWTNLPPGMVLEMKRDGSILTTNGVDVVNPELLKRLSEGRVSGTLVYSNALAGVILLLFPVTLVFILNSTGKMKPPIRFAAMALALFLGSAGFFWTGSKFGWLIAIGLGGLCLLRLRWPLKLKIAAVAIVAVLGLGIFAVRFDHYFAKGATSVVARFDYWRAAVQTTLANPLLGTGPGTFQRPYAEIKSPDAEMTRLTHNDYLEQFSDSGIPGGIFYATWIFLVLAVAGKKIWRAGNPIMFALLLGLLGWFIQGFGEFGLYIPASAWTAFTLLGCLLALSGNPMDKPAAAN
ncbi:MAG TPA: O-antigen ligase family protein [Verrucomicrobiae bacterium]|nr:O-antigen ligase family protein [Verrucomicrobiae bacterium]